MNLPQSWIEYARRQALAILPDDAPPDFVEWLARVYETTPLRDTNSIDGVSSQQG